MDYLHKFKHKNIKDKKWSTNNKVKSITNLNIWELLLSTTEINNQKVINIL